MNTSVSNKFIYIAFFILLFTFNISFNKAFAASCNFINGYSVTTGTVNFGDVVVQRDTPPGTIIKSITYKGLTNYGDIIDCTPGSYTMKYSDTAYQTFTFNGETYFDIGVPGYGVRMTSNSGYWQAVWNNGVLPILMVGGACHTGGSDYWFCGGSWGSWGTIFDLIRVSGDAKSGQIATPGNIVRASIDGQMDVYHFNLAATKITTLACQITTPSLVFPIGNVPLTEFGSSVGFTPAETSTQNLGLNCDAGANINVSLNATQNPDVSTPSVVALDNQGGAGTATGLGVQFIYNGSPLEINKNIVLKQSSGGQETFPITARYYQTKTTVTAGDASTSATLTLTYQ